MLLRKFAACCLLLALAAAADAQKKAVPLKIEGDTVLVVKGVPFRVVAPEGAGDYTWTMPPGVEGAEADNVLTVTKAPAGAFVIRVKMTTIDFDAKKVKKDAGEVTVVMGGAPDPGPPDPTPKPDDSLAKALAAALAQDTDPDKVALANKLGGMLTLAAKNTAPDQTLKTAADIDAVIRKTAQQLIGNLTIPTTRDVCGTYLKANLPAKRDAPLDDATRKKYAAAYAAVGAALEGLK